jgi:hypothetical protein
MSNCLVTGAAKGVSCELRGVLDFVNFVRSAEVWSPAVSFAVSTAAAFAPFHFVAFRALACESILINVIGQPQVPSLFGSIV